MKRFAPLLLVPTLASAGTVFEGYEAYYATLPGQLFTEKPIELQPYRVQGDQGGRLGWSGTAAGRSHKVEIRDGVLAIDGYVAKRRSVKAFSDEAVSDGDLGIGSTAYFSSAWACVENTPRSASGTAVRHKAVYLVRLTNTKPRAWKLPSLFAACRGVREQAGQIRFDKVEYRYPDGQDFPHGVSFREYAIQGGKFVPTDSVRTATFVEPDNVYRFAFGTQ